MDQPVSSPDYLDFEYPILELEFEIRKLEELSDSRLGQTDIGDELARLEGKCKKLKQSIFSSLSPWQISQLSRHLLRPHTIDYIQEIFTDFEELHGDRQFADDQSIITGLARFRDTPVAVVGHQKGRSTQEKIRHNFGMPKPEGYRKARKLFALAEKFSLPVLTFIDTPGAYPGIDAEERNQSGTIAENLKFMAQLKTPIISTIIGEGGSGGALAIGVCDCLLMLQYSTYSVISPEGCASILWKDTAKASAAAEAMRITSNDLSKLGLVDEVVAEPLGGAHRDLKQMSQTLAQVLEGRMKALLEMDTEALLEKRYQHWVGAGSGKFWNGS